MHRALWRHWQLAAFRATSSYPWARTLFCNDEPLLSRVWRGARSHHRRVPKQIDSRRIAHPNLHGWQDPIFITTRGILPGYKQAILLVHWFANSGSSFTKRPSSPSHWEEFVRLTAEHSWRNSTNILQLVENTCGSLVF